MEAGKSAMQMLGIFCDEGDQAPLSTSCFMDGRAFKIEIPSVEGLAAFAAVLEAAEKYDVRVDRIRRGSSVMVQKHDNIRQMVHLGVLNNIEVCLFVGPRAA